MKPNQTLSRAYLRLGLAIAVLALGGIRAETHLGALRPADLNEAAPAATGAPALAALDMLGGGPAHEATAVPAGLQASDWAGIRGAYERQRH